MPITKWYCQTCKAEVPLDHYATSVCGETLVHPDYAAAIIGDRDSQHTKGAVRVTHGLGCPRRAVIEHVEDYAVDPLDLNPQLTGTAWDAYMRVASKLPPMRFKGTIAGVKLSGEIDRLRGDTVEDWKNTKESNIKYVKDGPKADHRAQLSIYAELIEQSGLPRPVKARVWYHTAKDGEHALMPHTVPLMPIAEVLEMQPHGGQYTVNELYQQADDGFRTLNWRAMPMAGESMSFGAHSMCNYCSVRGICKEGANGLAPF